MRNDREDGVARLACVPTPHGCGKASGELNPITSSYVGWCVSASRTGRRCPRGRSRSFVNTSRGFHSLTGAASDGRPLFSRGLSQDPHNIGPAFRPRFRLWRVEDFLRGCKELPE
jgi:hypothetical protein